MKLFLIGTLLFSGGTAAAVQNEEVREGVKEAYRNVRQRVQKRVKANAYDKLREEGFPYPNEEKLAALTEEQSLAIISAIDQINATYNWSEMTDEEITEALEVIQEDMNLLADELGLDIPDNWLQKRFRRRVNHRTKKVIQERLLENLRENGIEYPKEERLAELTEEQAQAIMDKVDELNETYDWANMTDEEIMDAMAVVKEELRTLKDELGIAPPVRKHRHHSEEETNEDVVEDSDEV